MEAFLEGSQGPEEWRRLLKEARDLKNGDVSLRKPGTRRMEASLEGSQGPEGWKRLLKEARDQKNGGVS